MKLSMISTKSHKRKAILWIIPFSLCKSKEANAGFWGFASKRAEKHSAFSPTDVVGNSRVLVAAI